MQLYIEIIMLFAFVLSILFFRSMLIKIMLTIVLFPLIVLYLYKQAIPMVGVLEVNRHFFSEDTLSIAFYSYFIGYIAFLLILWPIRRKVFSYTPLFRVSNWVILIFFILFIISSYSLLQIRTETGGSASLYLSFSIFLLYMNKGPLKLFTILQIIYIVFILFMGERVDSILVLVYFLIVKRTNNTNGEKYNKVFLIIGLIGIFVFGIAIAALRGGSSLDTQLLLKSIYAQQTVTDVVYVYLCGVDYYLSNGIDLSLLGNLFLGLIPGDFYGVSSAFNYTVFLTNNYAKNPGGGLFFTEGMLAFGPLGVVGYLSLISFFIRNLFSSNKYLSKPLFILIFIMFCRIIWYGMIYTYKPILLTIAIFLILTNIKQIKKVN